MFVVGMHRSGTSAVTEVLGEMGFELPPPERLVGANDSNPHGHFEVELLVDLNEDVLHRLSGTWAAPPPGIEASLTPLLEAGLADEAARAFHESFLGPDFLYKDPRLCLLMPMWRAAVGDHPAVVVVRSPLGIAASMRRRNGLPLDYGLALWERYTRLALQGLAGLPVLVQSYSAMLAGEHDTLVSFAKQALADGADLDGPAINTLDRGLVSHDVDEAAAVDDPALSPEQQALTRTLVDLRGVHARFEPPDLGPETPNLDLAFRAMASAGDLGVREVQDRIDDATAVWRTEAERLRAVASDAEVRADHARYDEIDLLPPGRARRIAWSALGEPTYRRLSDQRAVRGGLDRARGVIVPLRRRAKALAPAPRGDEVGTRARGIADAFRAGRFDRPLTVLIPIHNAHDDVERCLDSLDCFSGDRVDWLLVDDASTDPAMAPLLDRYADRPNVTVLTNPENLGFTKSVNRGLAAAAPGDVVILNSDTVVTPGWERRLRVAAFEEPTRATATALSNAAGAFSFDAPMPSSLDQAAATATAVARASHHLRPDTPTGNGFCMFVTAEARAEVPSFDEESFPRAYGEENDYCMRLRAEGFTHVVADDCVVFHADSASFGAERQALVDRAMEVLDELHPDYHRLAREFVASEALAEAQLVAATAAADPPPATRRILHVLHDGHGGTEYHVDDLAGSLVDGFENWRLVAQREWLVLEHADGAGWTEDRRWHRPQPWDVRVLRRDADLAVASEVLLEFDIDLVHVHHLVGHTFDLVELAHALTLPVVLTAHDFYSACPSLNLLDDHVRFCGGTCTPGEGTCHAPDLWIDPDVPLKHDFALTWQAEWRPLFACFTRLITPSADTLAHLRALYGDDLPDATVIEHGRDVEHPGAVAHAPRVDEPIRLLLVGALNLQKGAASAVELAAEGHDRMVAVELLGELAPEFADLPVRSHGAYARDRLTARLAELRPTFIAVMSPWPETYCYVVSEAWANGVPVVVGPLGAPADRVREHGGGVVAPSLDPADVIDTVVTVARDPARYADLALQARPDNVRPVVAMAEDHAALYRDLTARDGVTPDGV